MQGIFLRKYGAETKIDFDLYETDASDLKTDAVYASGDTKIMKDEGAEADTVNGFADEGHGYSITLTAAEMQAARVKVYVVDQTSPKVWLDTTLVVETYGNANAQHSFDVEKAVKVLVNKAVQTKSTGVIKYYDDDGQTVILTHTPEDSDLSIARTPS
ncbi:MAG TPA: hypothetical protein VMW16_04940 [Sedimentisphaerales bacterium]|nr:hypothetical protein [Sedimentisphaerales bacterium]